MCALHPLAVLTMDSAFYLHGLTDVIPELVYVATPRNTTRIRHACVPLYKRSDSLFDRMQREVL